jgi:hypothetical protein
MKLPRHSEAREERVRGVRDGLGLKGDGLSPAKSKDPKA